MAILSTSWADGNTVHGTDLDTITNQINTAGYTSTATAAGTTTLTSSSNQIQVFTGTSTQTVKLPTTNIPAGNQWMIINNSTGAVTVQSSGANTIVVMAANTTAIFTAINATPTAATDWQLQYGAISAASGKSLTINNTMSLSAFDGASFSFGNTPTTLTSAVATSGTTQTVIATYIIPANTLTVGQTFQFEAFGTQATASGTGGLTYYACLGTAGTNADAVVTSVAATAANNTGANFEGMLTIYTIGSSGTAIAGAQILAGTTAAVSTTTATTTINTTSQLYLTIQCKAAAGTQTVRQAFISALQV